MAYMHKVNNCCGVSELVGINHANWSSRGAVRTTMRSYTSSYGRYDRFSVVLLVLKVNPKSTEERQARDRKKLVNFQNYVKRKNLGTIVRGEEVTNPNTGNILIPCVWSVNIEELVKFE